MHNLKEIVVMELHYGDIIEKAKLGEFDVIIHGCNCFHTMGAGIAKKIAKSYPQAYIADKKTPYGERSKLGTFSDVLVDGDVGNKFTIVNAYTQYAYGLGRDNFSYDTFPELLKSIKEKYGHLRIGLPLIGCNLAGGDEPRILKMIKEGFEGIDYKLMDLDRNRRMKLEDVKYDPNSHLSPMNINYPASFEYKDLKFFSVQQFVNYSKAKMFGDDASAKKVMLVNNHDIVKQIIAKELSGSDVLESLKHNRDYSFAQGQLSRSLADIKDFDFEAWKKKEVSIMTVANREKFKQNPELREYLDNSSKVGLFNHSPNHESLSNIKKVD